MGTITKIEQQKKNESRVNIYIDNKFFLGISTEIVYKLRLNKGVEIEEDKLKEIVDEENYIKAKNTAFNILSHNMQSEENIRFKLGKKDYEQHTIDRVIKILKEYKMIDDQELAKMIVNDKKHIKRYGRNRIKQDLYKKGIDKDIIEYAIKSQIKEDEEYKNALYLGQKKLRVIKDKDKRKVYEKLSRHLIYKGFNYDIVKKVVRQLLNDIDGYGD
ncbi:recombination regulator RecX [Clostridiisalibacter paucivorans]|uniref:recombination regulator RecX n=1 Tax=Clostridiisalibacter paucivorans TaxID=408753 RepID=UPI00047AED4D|nr:recombination regulator RecX [Clostridiisalibacter paucivorans]